MRVATLGVVIASTVLAGCSDIYYDRRETVASGAADAVASNMAVQTVDPWPRNVANTEYFDERRTRRARDPALSHRPRHLAERFRHQFGRLSQQQQQAPQPAASGGDARQRQREHRSNNASGHKNRGNKS